MTALRRKMARGAPCVASTRLICRDPLPACVALARAIAPQNRRHDKLVQAIALALAGRGLKSGIAQKTCGHLQCGRASKLFVGG